MQSHCLSPHPGSELCSADFDVAKLPRPCIIPWWITNALRNLTQWKPGMYMQVINMYWYCHKHMSLSSIHIAASIQVPSFLPETLVRFPRYWLEFVNFFRKNQAWMKIRQDHLITSVRYISGHASWYWNCSRYVVRCFFLLNEWKAKFFITSSAISFWKTHPPHKFMTC